MHLALINTWYFDKKNISLVKIMIPARWILYLSILPSYPFEKMDWWINICHGILLPSRTHGRRFDVDRSLRDTRKLAVLAQSDESRSRKQICLVESLNFDVNFLDGKSILLFKFACMLYIILIFNPTQNINVPSF